MIRSSRLAEPQSAVALDNAEPRICDFIAGTLIEVIAAARESTATAFCDLVFCRIVIITASSVNVTADALTIYASHPNLDVMSLTHEQVEFARVETSIAVMFPC